MRKRSTYRPKPVVTNPLTFLAPASKAEKDRVILKFLTAIEHITRGDHPGEDDWRDLSDCINTVETLALSMGKVPPGQVMPTVDAAIAGMVGAAKRFKAGQGMRMDAAGLTAVREVVAIYQDCLDGLTAREMAMAQAETQRRVHALLRSKTRSAEVIEL